MTTPNRQEAVAQRQFYVKVLDLDGYWATKTGGNSSADATKVYDGGSLTPDILTSPTEVENITVSRPYKRGRDAALLRRLRRGVGSFTTSISVTEADRGLRVSDDPVVYPVAVLMGVNEPEVDAASGDAARIELLFSVSEVR